ncbi:MalY/PatB family protein [Clostridium sp.]|uniref:MalY/PatB family protein n=1 Tax=Clostridium sp. TaxID=1506 RepID=UPI001A5AE97D|nr:PatB family C-S lyase [Clostridium sp.]MBK5239636.1 PatB family C-S lyase [Clostridium sp.]
MKYNFDEVIERRGTNAMNTDGFRDYIFKAPKTMEFPYADDEFIRMWVADMEFATPKVVIDAVKERLDKRILGYSMVFDPQYYEIFSKWTENFYDWTFEKKHLKTSHGVIPALFELIEYICKADEKILIITPSYAYFKHAADFNNIEIVTSDLINSQGEFTMDFEDLKSKAKDPKTTLCIFCNPHNPTGRVWTEKELKTFGDIAIENDLFVISDEIHCDLLRADKQHIPLAKLFPENNKIITCMAPSKTFNLAGMMFANIIIPNDEIREIWNVRHFGMENPLSIAAAQAAYEHGHEWLGELNLYLDENFKFTKNYLDEHLKETKFKISEATYLAWVNIGPYLPDEKELPLYFANNAGVLLEGGDMFVDNSEGFIRLNLACPRATLAEGLKRIKDAVLNK